MQKMGRHAERALACVAALAGLGATQQDSAADSFVEDLVWDVLGFVAAVDKTVRTRACQLLTLILHQLPELDEQLSASVQSALMARLRDKLPAVRTYAVTSVARLADPQEVSQPVWQAPPTEPRQA